MKTKSLSGSTFFKQNKIGLSISSLANNFRGLQCSFAKGLHQKWDFNTEIGYIFEGPDKISTTGYRLRINPRYNIASYENISGYVSAGYHIRKTTSDVENIFSRYEDSYYQQIIHKETRTLEGLLIMAGIIAKLTENLYITSGLGFGPGKLDVIFDGVPADAKEVFELNDISAPFVGNEKRAGSYNTMIIVANLNISYTW